MFNHRIYLERFLNDYKTGRDFYNNSVARVERVPAPAFRLIGIHHLTGFKNRGNHNLFMDVVDSNGQRLNERIEWGWEGQRPNEKPTPVTLDKPPYEPSGNIAIGKGQVVWAKVLGKNSDKITGVTTLLPDEDPWNTIGHHSYYAVWMWNVSSPDVPSSDINKTESLVNQAINLLEQALEELKK